MSTDLDKVEERYLAGSNRTRTASGLPVKTIYRPEDVAELEYERALGDPGEYPYTRGAYANMYRGRLFSLRLITGCPTPRLTNDRLKLLVSQGESAINVIGDQPTMMGIDPDHPRAEGGVGLTGAPVCTTEDMDTILDGLPLDRLSTMLSLGTPIALPSYLLVAQQRGIPLASLRGTNPLMGPGLYPPVCNYAGKEWYKAQLFGPEAFFATIAWMDKTVPHFNPTNYNSYNIRETGVSAPQEMGFILAQAFETLRMAVEYHADVELMARKMSFTCSAMIDLFEEVAKFRAARRVFARTLKEKFQVKNPKSLRMKVHVNTGGSLMEHPQAKINVVRGAYAALGAVLGGIQSMQIASYDEPIAIPTEEAASMALRTEQILAHETGAGTVVDPLGGSYYVESLTNRMEEEIQAIVDEIDSLGGMTSVIESGWLEQQMEKEWLRRQQELENRERIVVGVNEYVVSSEEDEMVPAYAVDREAVQQYVQGIVEHKRARPTQPLKDSLDTLRAVMTEGKQNPIPYLMECCRAGATTGELLGTYRMARGFTFDPFDEVKYPF